MREATSPDRRIDEDMERRLAKRLMSRLWGMVPDRTKVVVAIVTTLGGGGLYLKDYIPITVESVWETKEDAKREHDAIRSELKALPAAVADEMERRSAKRGRR